MSENTHMYQPKRKLFLTIFINSHAWAAMIKSIVDGNFRLLVQSGGIWISQRKKRRWTNLQRSWSAHTENNLVALYEFGESACVDWEGNGLKILAVLETLGTKELRVLSEDRRKWEKNGLPAPLMLTKDTLLTSADVFPMEFLEMKEANQFICGSEDVLSGLLVPLSNLRRQLEEQAKGKLIHLRQSYIEAAGDKKKLGHLIAVSIEPFTEVMRNALRLYDKPAPVAKEEIIRPVLRRVRDRPGAVQPGPGTQAAGSGGVKGAGEDRLGRP